MIYVEEISHEKQHQVGDFSNPNGILENSEGLTRPQAPKIHLWDCLNLKNPALLIIEDSSSHHQM